MASRTGPVHVATSVRRYKGKVYQTHLLRRTFRQGKKVLHETLGNLSHLPAATIELIRRSLKGETFVSRKDAFRTIRSVPHGHVAAVLGMIHKLGLDSLIGSKPCRQRDLVLAMIVQRILFPCSKLATTRDWHTTTLAEELHVADADENELYAALDWLVSRQRLIEGKLAKRHLANGALLAYYVQWHLKRAWEPLLFEEEGLDMIRRQRDPVAAAEPSPEVQHKKSTHQTAHGLPVQSFATLLRELGRCCRNTCLVASDPAGNTFEQLTDLTPLQAEAFRLLDL